MQVPTDETLALSKARVMLTCDPTVALDDIIPVNGTTAGNRTRIYHHVNESQCALAYAVSQRGARRALYEISRKNETGKIDDILRGLCNSTEDKERRLICVTTQPSLFSRWRGDRGSEHIRWSVRMNMEKYVRDDREWVDQYP